MTSVVARFMGRTVSLKPRLLARYTLQLESSLLGSVSTWSSFLFSFSTPTPTTPEQIISLTPQSSHYLSWCWKDAVSGSFRCWSQSSRTLTTSKGAESEADNAVGDRQDNRAQESVATRKGCTCWKCGSPVSCRDFFCKCGAPQLLEGRVDYFELLGCPRSVFVEAKLLEMNFKNMQRAFHPDLFATRSADERDVSSINSTMANKAYQTLVHPMQRVKYLMRLLGSSVLEDGDEGSSLVPPDFLMEVMDTREHLEHCSSVQEAESVLATTKNAIQECLRTMDSILKAGGGKHELATPAIRLRYYYRIEEEARNVIHQLEDMGSRHSGQ